MKIYKFTNIVNKYIILSKAFLNPFLQPRETEFDIALSSFDHYKVFQMLDDGYQCSSKQKAKIVKNVISTFNKLLISKSNTPDLETNILGYGNEKITNEDALYMMIATQYDVAPRSMMLNLLTQVPHILDSLSFQHIVANNHFVGRGFNFTHKKELAEHYAMTYSLEVKRMSSYRMSYSEYEVAKNKSSANGQLTKEAENLDFTSIIDEQANQNLKNNLIDFIDNKKLFYPNFVLAMDHFCSREEGSMPSQIFNHDSFKRRLFLVDENKDILRDHSCMIISTSDFQDFVSHFVKKSLENNITLDMLSSMALEKNAAIFHAWLANISYNNPKLEALSANYVDMVKLQEISGKALETDLDKTKSYSEFVAHHFYRHMNQVAEAEIAHLKQLHKDKTNLQLLQAKNSNNEIDFVEYIKRSNMNNNTKKSLLNTAKNLAYIKVSRDMSKDEISIPVKRLESLLLSAIEMCSNPQITYKDSKHLLDALNEVIPEKKNLPENQNRPKMK